MTDVTPKLAWKGVTKRFDGRAVLDGLDLSVAPGKSLVIIGGSGQGKSVTIKTAMGLMRPEAGKIELDGKNVVGLSENARRKLFSRIGVLFQGAALFDSLTIWENVAFRLLNADGVGRSEAKARAVEALDQVRLAPSVADRFPSELSGGMQKRAGLARAIVAQPEILFFDEPTTGLDPITAAAINQLISDQVRRLGSTAVSITHDLASAQTIGDEIAMLHDGKIIWRGPAADLHTTDNPYVRQFVEGRAEGPIAHAV
ncbi:MULTISPECIES: ABC transporter ATP-binding protein [Caulobacter]|jgi:phospholipid/cholesterol/gamma-HCH transport system ATP-binding protein|uniref:ABC-type transport system involved in resistance to organic solvent, ATPase component n=1 Tax=Caulobacter vibrioides OR37 TaxID=1292034 RepID=R0D2E6_CAUVI|nr:MULTISPECIES: ABC transporter ATP-binding protein [Caulobacter]ENZ82796.1 ABC-type transport system involved in resistance to organic solvent, ATPase component [Caulobacter vibrioides OR37]MBQ1559546.1 ABC transporter ATP-binding protein [Caulobacter sp.]